MLQRSPLAIALILALTTTACGGGGGGGSNSGGGTTPTPPPSTELTGILIDSPVANVAFQTATKSGTTNENGEFTYEPGETVTFSIGDLVLGTIPAAETITPLDLADSNDVTDPAVLNRIRLLQSLDTDGNPDNGITISDLAAGAATALDFNQSATSFATSQTVLSFISNAGQTSPVTELVSPEDALLHFQSVLTDNGITFEANNNSDTDEDGVLDQDDAFPDDPNETLDTDGDGIGNNADTDDDGDGVVDADDAFPLDNTEDTDTDGDGVGDNSDAFPNNPQEDTDTDGDGVGDNSDAFPTNPEENTDTDGDGVGDNSDAFPNNPQEDTDTDGDGVGDNSDAFPNNPQENTDTDGDGVGDNSDAFPNNPQEDTDTDGDGVGDNSDAFPTNPEEDTDTDGDGVGDMSDAFPNDPQEDTDTDGDRVGDNSDAFPNDPEETTDTDDDGLGDNADIDDDNDRLIEIYTLEDLDKMRQSLDGSSFPDSNDTPVTDGCGTGGCYGYELMADLNFDTNGNGTIDEQDEFYDWDNLNEANGWQPIGDETNPFTASFNGNGYTIANLHMNYPESSSLNSINIGLFGVVSGRSDDIEIHIEDLTLSGDLTSILGGGSVGSLIGAVISTTGIVELSNLTISDGVVTADPASTSISTRPFNIGGLAGIISVSGGSIYINNVYVNTTIRGEAGAGGIASSAFVSGNAKLETNHCVTTGTIEYINIASIDESTAGVVGGIFGLARTIDESQLLLKRSEFKGTLSGPGSNSSDESAYLYGGLIGWADVQSGNTAISIEENIVEAIINAPNTQNVGGAIGSISSSSDTTSITLSSNSISANMTVNNESGGFLGGIFQLSETGGVLSLTLSNNIVSGTLNGTSQLGGFIGSTEPGNIGSNNPPTAANLALNVNDNFVSAMITSSTGTDIGEFVGKSWNANYSGNHFVNDKNTGLFAVGILAEGNAISGSGDITGFTLEQMQCPTSAGDASCESGLYEGWGDNLNSDGLPAWDFGTNTQLPGLLIDGTVYRDADGDGTLDEPAQ
ncbi:thrombospondin type 3 repeat-containing protein [Marinibactrum halimedae]|nr:thrombospondin type 3 repeat-containing protein [Marinibactrum halimedae]MCD9460124.1 thrombospondin type 3 repeat-containing protein [Marinibactrum halimedae]